MLSFFNLPCDGFCKMSELLTVPRIVIGNKQLSPDATLMSPLEFSPQSASSTNFGQSEAAGARDTDIGPVAPMISAKAATLDTHIVDFLVFMHSAWRNSACLIAVTSATSALFWWYQGRPPAR